MKTFLTPKEIENLVLLQVNHCISNALMQGIYFENGDANSADGIYVFVEDQDYVFLQTEKGSVLERIKTNSIDDVIYRVLDIVFFNEALKYTKENVEQGKDSRRTLFARELALWRKCGDRFYKKKRCEIDGLLSKHPYKD